MPGVSPERLELVPVGHRVLREKAQEVQLCDAVFGDVQAIIARMLDIATGRSAGIEGDLRIMVGLAAPQLGVKLRIIVVNTSAGTGAPATYQVFVNPRIVGRSKEVCDGPEGCFSCGKCIWGNVSRAKMIIMEALTETGEFVRREFEDLVARIIQHEIDHLDGIRFPDRIPPEQPERLHYVDVAEPGKLDLYRGGEWSTWPDHYPRKKWLQLIA